MIKRLVVNKYRAVLTTLFLHCLSFFFPYANRPRRQKDDNGEKTRSGQQRYTHTQTQNKKIKTCGNLNFLLKKYIQQNLIEFVCFFLVDSPSSLSLNEPQYLTYIYIHVHVYHKLIWWFQNQTEHQTIKRKDPPNALAHPADNEPRVKVFITCHLSCIYYVCRLLNLILKRNKDTTIVVLNQNQ